MNIEQAHDIFDYARKRLIEEIHHDKNSVDVSYWRGYTDGVNRIIKEMKNSENQ